MIYEVIVVEVVVVSDDGIMTAADGIGAIANDVDGDGDVNDGDGHDIAVRKRDLNHPVAALVTFHLLQREREQ